jgi:CRISPR/Cas system-associated exonuclease Cas4 (RecB family)
MTLPADFHFSQASLQDYVDCGRRFQLRSLIRLAWPAVETEPVVENERQMQRGAMFHRLVQQHLVGLPEESLVRQVNETDLQRWWRNYLDFAKQPSSLIPLFGSPLSAVAEVVLSAPLMGYRIVAKYDAILRVEEEAGAQAIIFDWKTIRKRPIRRYLADRLQTRVYPFLLVEAGAHLNRGVDYKPEQVEMVYWYAEFPAEAERFPYDQDRYEEDKGYLADLIVEIASQSRGEFPQTSDQRRCRYCRYRSLCERGIAAGRLLEGEMEGGEEGQSIPILDYEQVAEIDF